MDVEPEDASMAPKAMASPDTLQDICLEFVSENLKSLCTTDPETTMWKLRDSEAVINMDLSERLLKRLSEKEKLTDAILGVFSCSGTTMLKRVWLNGSYVTEEGLLQLLAQHKLTELHASQMANLTLDHLVHVLEVTDQCNLKSLDISWLRVHGSTLDNAVMEALATKVRQLEHLDASMVTVDNLEFLHTFKDVPLRSLTLFHKQCHSTEVILMRDVAKFNNLQHLDISIDSTHTIDYVLGDVLEDQDYLPLLTSLDISGSTYVSECSLRQFHDSRQNIKFLGLAITHLCELDFFRPNIKVTGHYNDDQVLEGLRRYSNRPNYVIYLLQYIEAAEKFRTIQTDMIKAVLTAMRSNKQNVVIQTAGSCMLSNLIDEFSDRIHVSVLKEVADGVLVAMSLFPDNGELQQSCMWMLFDGRILADVKFNFLKAVELLFACISTFTGDEEMCRDAYVLCTYIILKLSCRQKLVFGTTPIMKNLLEIIKDKLDNKSVDDEIFESAMKIIWALTDEQPRTCDIFMNQGGFQLYFKLLQVYGSHVVQKRVYGVLANIAEVRYLRSKLLDTDFLKLVSASLTNDKIEVSYVAAIIVAILTSDPELELGEESQIKLTHSLYDRVLIWGDYTGPLVTFESFKSVLGLLNYPENPAAQLWAIWTLWHTCTKNADQYCPLVWKEGGMDVLQNVLQTPHLDVAVTTLVKKVIKILEDNRHLNLK